MSLEDLVERTGEPTNYLKFNLKRRINFLTRSLWWLQQNDKVGGKFYFVGSCWLRCVTHAVEQVVNSSTGDSAVEIIYVYLYGCNSMRMVSLVET